ncbi:integrase, partial [Sulfolobus sp. E3]
RQRGDKYYVYFIEKDDRGKVKEHYVGPLADVVEFYVRNGGSGALPHSAGDGI